MSSVIIIFHTPSNSGYAMYPLEKMFFQVGCKLFGGRENVHFAFKNFNEGKPESLPDDYSNLITLDTSSSSKNMLYGASKYIKQHNIKNALCFDLQVRSPICNMLRSSGVRKIISYWGAPISSKNPVLKLFLKKIEVALSRNKPDLFIFESEAMRELAVYGRGVQIKNTCVIPTGVDTNRFKPDKKAKQYIYKEFNIAENSKIIVYSGHMEKRKGVETIIKTAIDLIDNKKLDHWHFLICGNRPGEEKSFIEMLENTSAKEHVTFAGYRNDIDKIIPGCDLGVIASSGW